MTKVIILGAGGFAREVLWLFWEANRYKYQWDIIGFIDEDSNNHGKIICDLPVLGGFEYFDSVNKDEIKVICGVGSPRTKVHFVEITNSIGLQFCSVVHPNARMSSYVEIGEGTLITAGNIITTQVVIGNHVCLNLNCTIGHDCTIGDYTTIAPGTNISGNVTLGKGVDLGTGSIILPGVSIGNWSVIGAGAVVTGDIPDNVVAIGIPAKVKSS